MATASELARSGPLPLPRICCLDLDTFFVSVERVLDPSLEGKPVVVGGRPGSRGVVTAASYEVRRLGVKSGMSLVEAGKLAPDAIYLPTRGDTYGQYAQRVRKIAERYAPTVLIASIDEMFLDLSGCERLYGDANDGDAAIEQGVLALTRAIDDELGLPASAGIATSKVMAKVASSLAKPRGVMLVPAGVERAVLAPLPVRSFPGIGPVGERKLVDAGYETLAPSRRRRSRRSPRSSARGRSRSSGGSWAKARVISAASAQRSPSTILRAKPSAASRTNARSAKTSRIPPRLNQCFVGFVNGSAGARASGTSRPARSASSSATPTFTLSPARARLAPPTPNSSFTPS
jgi:impB/mucB/samB family